MAPDGGVVRPRSWRTYGPRRLRWLSHSLPGRHDPWGDLTGAVGSTGGGGQVRWVASAASCKELAGLRWGAPSLPEPQGRLVRRLLGYGQQLVSMPWCTGVGGRTGQRRLLVLGDHGGFCCLSALPLGADAALGSGSAAVSA
jgi:hypothetical protein